MTQSEPQPAAHSGQQLDPPGAAGDARGRERRVHHHSLRTHRRFRLSFINENTLNEVWTVGMSQRKVVASILLIFAALGCMAATLIVFTPLRTLLPGYLKQEERRANVVNVYRVDSLLAAARATSGYLATVGAIVRGDSLLAAAIPAPAADHAVAPDSLLAASDAEQRLAAAVEERKRYAVGGRREAGAATAVFHLPVAGAQCEASADRLLIRAPRGAAVAAPAPGTVVDVSYSPAAGWTVIVQHPNGYLTRIAGMASASVATGARVAADQALGLASDAAPLALQLWNAGVSLDPRRLMPI